MAATLYSTEVTAQNAAAWTPSKASVNGGVKRYAYGKYTTDGSSETAGTTAAMVTLPAGARVTSLKVWCDDIGSASQTMDIGVQGRDGSGYYDLAQSNADDVDYFEAALDVATAALTGTEIIAASTDLGKEFDKDVYVTFTARTATYDASKNIWFEVEYVVS